MNDQIAISVNNVSKKFRLFNSPKERLLEALHPFNKKYHKEFWALKNISFEVKKGATVGIVGRNGAGKSTLLQIICSILRPTTGTITLRGRISTLLSLGAGFNPEFSGRQNVLLNGIVMGFSEEEMQKRLPEIEAFADIGGFIDQPMKIYSSGMSVRLAFAAAINVDPDILVVDEALAVGDAKFQHKCYGKFLEFQKAGKTIVFVTHDTNAVIKHCDSAILLERGEIVERGEPKHIINYYLDLLFTGKISNYQLSPVLVQEGFRGFNIVHYRTKYYAFLQSIGSIDLTNISNDSLREYVNRQECIVGSSFEEVKHLVNQINPIENDSISKNVKMISVQRKTELDKFFKEITPTDNCINRNTYNKNEYRFGDKRGEIWDYFILCGESLNPVSIYSGDAIDIYLKTKFYKTVDFPLFGFSIKTIDGMTVYGSNTRFSQTPIDFAQTQEIIIFKFSIRMDLHPGDFFIDLGIAEKLIDKDEPIDIRCGIIHLAVKQKDHIFDGLVNLLSTFEEISRIKTDFSSQPTGEGLARIVK